MAEGGDLKEVEENSSTEVGARWEIKGGSAKEGLFLKTQGWGLDMCRYI